MQISLHHLNQAKDQQMELSETIPPDSLAVKVPGLIRLEPVKVTAQVLKLDSHLIEVKAEQSTHATLTCSRCLSEIEIPVQTEWVEQFTDVENQAGETEEHEIHLIEGNILDLTPYIREALLLSIPLAPVCREDCKGLCPKCGVNKNTDACECRIESIDPRLAKLQELLNKDR
ncbi:YceD family protein [Paenactinomyces guangxiensis]|uniref:DUF177 domain-containing protein n=1 Tax=Paenactinomyces guangxiensis TaxID=1490290 RepID=A0A7W1WRX1_9BACL|nr:DUF177 domain-containing protein [Paenactinomyces guangxiensis]MBA4494741.1 DUF177 domain-containing protein [Paenactinomyces guangxiensis]MBH8591825.1 DUF177 domain-containing protein [Paenactinomyces guangxiensis]